MFPLVIARSVATKQSQRDQGDCFASLAMTVFSSCYENAKINKKTITHNDFLGQFSVFHFMIYWIVRVRLKLVCSIKIKSCLSLLARLWRVILSDFFQRTKLLRVNKFRFFFREKMSELCFCIHRYKHCK